MPVVVIIIVFALICVCRAVHVSEQAKKRSVVRVRTVEREIRLRIW